MSTIVWVSAEIPGFHRWAGAPGSVSFLRNEHRHLFKFKLLVHVQHSDRDVEFFTLQKELKNFLLLEYGNPANFGKRSCEMIGENILAQFKEAGFSVVSVEVSEDGENGAIVYAEDMDY